MANIFILHGDDINGIDEAAAKLVQEQKDSGFADFNMTVLYGKGLSANDFSNAVLAAPFLTDFRVVLLQEPLAMAGGRDGNQKFLKLLEETPPSTHLYLIIKDAIERKDWEKLGKTSFLRKWVEKNPDKAQLTTFQLPAQNAMPGWIMKKAAALGGKFDASGAAALAAAIGNDTQAAAHEIEKLLLYVGFSRPVDDADVNELVSGVTSVSVFDMVDSLVVGNSKIALSKLHQLEETEEIPQLFAMIIRQFRLLVQTRSILDRRGNSQTVQKELGQIPFVADKLCRQASAFTSEKLKTIYGQLLEFDYQFKTSGNDPAAALDLFILDVAQLLRKR